MTLPDVALGLVRAQLTGVDVFDGPPLDANGSPVSPARYVSMYPDLGTLSAQDVAQTSDLVTFRIVFTYVTSGTQAGSAGVRWLADKTRAALVDVVPSVTGWQFGPFVLESTRPIQDDPDEPTTVLFASDTFVVMGARA